MCRSAAARRLAIGGKGSRLDLGPVTLEVELVSRSDGNFDLEDILSQMVVLGRTIRMGPCAVVRHKGLTILLTSRRVAPMDLGQWRSQGIDPEKPVRHRHQGGGGPPPRL